MNYCLDISSLPYGTGVSRYTSNLARALPSTTSFFGSSMRQTKMLSSFSPRARVFPLPPKAITYVFHNLNLPVELFVGTVDVFHTWDWYLPRPKKTKIVTTVHDLALFKHPETAHPEIRAHHQMVIERMKQFKPQIIAVSEATKTDLVDLFDIDPDDITVVYEALPEESKRAPTNSQSDKKPYILLVGTQEPRKNIANQIKAWRSVKKDFNLVLVGKSGWESIPDETGLIKVGYQQDQELADLYHSADLLMYCSLAEGFGLPILEAFHHGIPVLTSNCSSMKEIGSDAVTYADPLDVQSIEQGITVALQSSLQKKATARLHYFSWEKAAKETLKVYQKAAKKL